MKIILDTSDIGYCHNGSMSEKLSMNISLSICQSRQKACFANGANRAPTSMPRQSMNISAAMRRAAVPISPAAPGKVDET